MEKKRKSKMKNLSTNSGKDQTKEKKKEHRNFTPTEKSKAVLSVWSERRSPAEVCREMSITWMQFNQWQNQSMKGMFSALENKKDQVKCPPISERLEKLMERRSGIPKPSKMAKHLEKLQQEKAEPKTA
jgi:transposase-like protein